AAGNTSSANTWITVVDTTPPHLTAPAPQTIEATGPDGAPATVTCTATDLVSAPTITYVRTRATYPLGTTTVGCSAKDAAGNASSADTTITVVDTTPPQVVG